MCTKSYVNCTKGINPRISNNFWWNLVVSNSNHRVKEKLTEYLIDYSQFPTIRFLTGNKSWLCLQFYRPTAIHRHLLKIIKTWTPFLQNLKHWRCDEHWVIKKKSLWYTTVARQLMSFSIYWKRTVSEVIVTLN